MWKLDTAIVTEFPQSGNLLDSYPQAGSAIASNGPGNPGRSRITMSDPPSTPVGFRRVNPFRRTSLTSSPPDLPPIDGTPGERLVPAPWIPPERDQGLPHGRRARRRGDAVRPPPDPLRASREDGLG